MKLLKYIKSCLGDNKKNKFKEELYRSVLESRRTGTKLTLYKIGFKVDVEYQSLPRGWDKPTNKQLKKKENTNGE